MGRETIRCKITVESSPSRVFQYLIKIEPRLRISPFFKLLNFEFITPGPVKVGTKYKVITQREGRIFTHIGLIKELEEERKIVLEDEEGKLRITFLLKPTSQGTELTYIEEFELSDEALLREEEKEGNLLRRLLEFFFRTGGFCQHELQKRKLSLLEDLEKKAFLWLSLVKKDIEEISTKD